MQNQVGENMKNINGIHVDRQVQGMALFCEILNNYYIFNIKVQYPMYINIRVQWAVHKMGCSIKNNMIIKNKVRLLNDLVHITLLCTIHIFAE